MRILTFILLLEFFTSLSEAETKRRVAVSGVGGKVYETWIDRDVLKSQPKFLEAGTVAFDKIEGLCREAMAKHPVIQKESKTYHLGVICMLKYGDGFMYLVHFYHGNHLPNFDSDQDIMSNSGADVWSIIVLPNGTIVQPSEKSAQ